MGIITQKNYSPFKVKHHKATEDLFLSYWGLRHISSQPVHLEIPSLFIFPETLHATHREKDHRGKWIMQMNTALHQ